MQLGIGSYTYTWSIGFPGAQSEKPMTALDLLAQAVEMGVRLVQIGPYLLLHKLSGVELDVAAAWARDRNIEVEVGTQDLDRASLIFLSFWKRSVVRAFRLTSFWSCGRRNKEAQRLRLPLSVPGHSRVFNT